jgi:hypothetical protein
VATYRIVDRADEFRIEIIGRFSVEGVEDVKRCWEAALLEAVPRRLSIDISRLSGFDASGRKLLAEMYRHGTEFAARTPSSLAFLNEIANMSRAPAPVIPAPVELPRKRPLEPALRAIAVGQ